MWILILYVTATFHYFDADKVVYFGQEHMAADVNRSVVMQEFNSKETCELALMEIETHYKYNKMQGVCVAK